MKKLILALAIGCIAAFGFSGSASAAGSNCTFTEQPVYISGGNVYTNIFVSACTQVSAFRIKYTAPGYSNTAGWFDLACGCYANGMIGPSVSPPSPAYADYTWNNPGSGTHQMILKQAPWWFGACRSLESTYFYQIKNSVTGTWGFVVAKTVGPNSVCN